MYFLADFARTPGAKDKKERKKRSVLGGYLNTVGKTAALGAGATTLGVGTAGAIYGARKPNKWGVDIEGADKIPFKKRLAGALRGGGYGTAGGAVLGVPIGLGLGGLAGTGYLAYRGAKALKNRLTRKKQTTTNA